MVFTNARKPLAVFLRESGIMPASISRLTVARNRSNANSVIRNFLKKAHAWITFELTMTVSSSNVPTVIPSLLIDGIWKNTTQPNMELYTVLTDTVVPNTNVLISNCQSVTIIKNLIGPFQGHPLSLYGEKITKNTTRWKSGTHRPIGNWSENPGPFLGPNGSVPH